MSSAFAQDSAQETAPPQRQQWRLTFMSAFAGGGEEESAGASLRPEQATPEVSEQGPSMSMPSAEEPASAGPQSHPTRAAQKVTIPSPFEDAAKSSTQFE
jgi:hypothetical protein